MGVKINPWTMEETVKEIENRLETGKSTVISAVNAAKIVNLQKDQQLHKAITSSDIVLFDGIGVVWAARIMGYKVPQRVAGIDLFQRLIMLAQEKETPIYLLGAEKTAIEKAAEKIQDTHPKIKIAGFHHGYFTNDEEMAATIKNSGAKMLFIGMSSPQKENFMTQWGEKTQAKIMMGVGGTFDILAGKTKRAPKKIQQIGLEWLYRTTQEPRRLWKRYLVTNTLFIILLTKEIFKKHDAPH
ncbi:UDP-N-acetyl-D-mannosaminuronic acid transferase [uncultured archaeon]|nr:UDP-N-acetyl-D-mannosaminuronic acid transferase [uncultured archaeon]